MRGAVKMTMYYGLKHHNTPSVIPDPDPGSGRGSKR